MNIVKIVKDCSFYWLHILSGIALGIVLIYGYKLSILRHDQSLCYNGKSIEYNQCSLIAFDNFIGGWK